MQAIPPPPSPAPQGAPVPVSPYQPAKGFDRTKLAYSFERWLMIGIVLILAATMFTQAVAMFGPPDAPGDDSTLDDLSEYLEELDGYNDMNRVVASIGVMMQTIGLGLIGYALLRESNSNHRQHTALRVTGMVLGVLVVANLAAQNINVF